MAKRPRTKKADTAVSGILNALKFCEPASKEIGQPNQTHIRLANNWAVASDGVVTIGCPIDTDIVANPHAATLIAALSKCDGATEIVQLGNDRLSIRSGRFSAIVPCLFPEALAAILPDQPCANITPAVFESLRIVGPVAQENAQRVMLASVMLRANSAVATDGKIVMEHWHGIDLPPVLLPKSLITITNKLETIDKLPTFFGFSPTSATFYFDDKSWIKSQLYSESWPDVDRVLNTPFRRQVEKFDLLELKEAIERIEPFTDTDEFFTAPGSVRTHQSPKHGALCTIEGSLPDGLSFSIEHMLLVLPHATTIDFQAGEHKDRAVLYGPNMRAVLSQNKAS